MICFPNCKINLGLRVLGKRSDGYHNIETIFYPVKWCDVIEVLPAKEYSFESSGIYLDGNTEDNLCVKAFRILQRDFNLPNVKMCLLKNIPIGAGLGGGSADAAFTLMLLNNLFELDLSPSQLKNYASQLGSDCSFFIDNQPSYATEKGNSHESIALDFSSFHILIVYPNVHVNTTWAYGNLSHTHKNISNRNFKEIIKSSVTDWKENLKNDFEEAVFKTHPQIAEIKNQLYNSGALYASMSGSGSAVFGLFENEPDASAFSKDYKTFSGKM